MKKLSKNGKLNYVLNDILNDLEELGLEEVKRYYIEFNNCIDYNLYAYGNMRIYSDDIKQLYVDAGYKTKLDYVETYKRQIGYMVRLFVSNEYLRLKEF